MSESIDVLNQPEKQDGMRNQPGKKKGKLVLVGILAAVGIVLAGTFFYFNYQNANYLKTNNASVQGNIIPVTAKTPGRVADVKVKQGDAIHLDEALIELETPSPDNTTTVKTNINAPIDGTVLKTVVATGQSIAAGQTVAYVTQYKDLFINCNVDEKDITKIKIGQDVDISIDQFGNQKFSGTVSEIGVATTSAFSIMPQSTSTTFIKSTQLIPVKIQFTEEYNHLVIGANATVSISLK